MPFKFIDNTTIDQKARKLIRSHAAKAKNVGRKLSRPSRTKDPKPKSGNSRAVELIPYARNETGVPVSRIEHQIGDELSVVAFPFEATPKARALVQRVLSFVNSHYAVLEVCSTIDFTTKSVNFMVEKTFRDEACFYCTAAMSLVALNSRPQDQEAFRLVALTFRLLNRKLSSDEALKDQTMAAVICLTHYERLRGNYSEGLVHLKGLQRMVELRGGISQLTKSQPGLTQKIFRADLELALYVGSTTIFSAVDAPGHNTISWLRRTFTENQACQFSHLGAFQELEPDLPNLLTDISGLAWMLNGYLGHKEQLSSFAFHDVLLLLGYRILQISPVCGPRPTSWLENALQASLLVFMSSFLIGLGGILPAFPPLSRLARTIAQNHPAAEGTEGQEMFLWTLFIGSTSIFSVEDDAWLLPRLRKATHDLNLDHWEGVSYILAKFPWVNALHDKPAQRLWDRLQTQR